MQAACCITYIESNLVKPNPGQTKRWSNHVPLVKPLHEIWRGISYGFIIESNNLHLSRNTTATKKPSKPSTKHWNIGASTKHAKTPWKLAGSLITTPSTSHAIGVEYLWDCKDVLAVAAILHHANRGNIASTLTYLVHVTSLNMIRSAHVPSNSDGKISTTSSNENVHSIHIRPNNRQFRMDRISFSLRYHIMDPNVRISFRLHDPEDGPCPNNNLSVVPYIKVDLPPLRKSHSHFDDGNIYSHNCLSVAAPIWWGGVMGQFLLESYWLDIEEL